jgi:surfeit locus 1 family protein
MTPPDTDPTPAAPARPARAAEQARLLGQLDWVVLIAALAAIALTARLGWWQVTRGQTKAELHQRIEARMAEPALAWTDLPREAGGLETLSFRRVALQGRWLAEHTVYLDNRQMLGRPGYYVVTPLALPGGEAVLVQRGWLPRHATDRTQLPPVITPEGPVRLDGRLAPTPSRLYEFDQAASGPIRQNLDIAAYAAEIGVPLRPYAVLQLDEPGAPAPAAAATDPAAPALRRDWPQPQADVHKHYAYALQWFLMSATVAGLYVWFRILLPRRRARAAAAAA